MRGVVMSLVVAGSNVVYFLWRGDSLPSPRYGALTRHGNESNPGGAAAVTIAMLLFAGFCYWMHRRQVEKDRETKERNLLTRVRGCDGVSPPRPTLRKRPSDLRLSRA